MSHTPFHPRQAGVGGFVRPCPPLPWLVALTFPGSLPPPVPPPLPLFVRPCSPPPLARSPHFLLEWGSSGVWSLRTKSFSCGRHVVSLGRFGAFSGNIGASRRHIGAPEATFRPSWAITELYRSLWGAFGVPVWGAYWGHIGALVGTLGQHAGHLSGILHTSKTWLVFNVFCVFGGAYPPGPCWRHSGAMLGLLQLLRSSWLLLAVWKRPLASWDPES